MSVCRQNNGSSFAKVSYSLDAVPDQSSWALNDEEVYCQGFWNYRSSKDALLNHPSRSEGKMAISKSRSIINTPSPPLRLSLDFGNIRLHQYHPLDCSIMASFK